FVWDWMDQGLFQLVPEKFKKNYHRDYFFAYGGWWENQHGIYNSNNFCMNGLIDSEGKPHPGLHEIKHYYTYVKVEPVDLASGKFKISNRYDFSNLKDQVTGMWMILQNQKMIKHESIKDLDIAPHESKEITIDVSDLEKQDGKEYFVYFSFRTANKQFYADAGHEVYDKEFRLPMSTFAKLPVIDTIKPKISRSGSLQTTVSSPLFTAKFNHVTGDMVQYEYKQQLYMQSGPQPDFWRALTDNDWGFLRNRGKENFCMHGWKHAQDVVATKLQDTIVGNTAIVTVEKNLSQVGGTVTTKYTFYGNGVIDVHVDYKPGSDKKCAHMIRFGTELTIAPGFNQLAWYGRGPLPTYSDRNAEMVRLVNSTVEEQYVDYSRPQENGYKTDVRWLKLFNDDAHGLMFNGDPLFCFGASHYTKDQMEQADYTYEMEPSENIYLNIDLIQMGVGGNNSWGATPLESYMIKNEAMSFNYRITPF
ncbi:MAG: DUF4981 domain-containing protein, partial [Bacteroidales bacterium]|nr:DUF4981 domain-containing protein [Bacteroidales bacterium]